jgi:hypothetical protein
MSPLLMWLRSHPAERLAMGIVLLLGIGIGWQVVVHRGQPSSSQASTTGPTTTPVAGAGPGAGPAASPSPSVGSSPSPQDLAAATGVAQQFLVALTSYRYDDTPYTLGQRVRPYVTDLLYSGGHLGEPSAPYGKRPDLHEVDTPTVTSARSEGYSAWGQLGFLARVRIEGKTDQGTSTQDQSYELFLVRQSDRWRVDSYTAGTG